MSNVTAPNYTLAATNDAMSAIWKLTRTMKASGWITKASSDGTNKDTTGTYANDKWVGTIGTGGSGSGASVNSVSNGVATLTGLSGFSSLTAGQRWIELSGGSSPGNNGTFKILSYVSATSVKIRNSSAVAGDTVSWTERIPLSDTYTIAANSWICMQGPSTIKLPIKTLPLGNTVINKFTGDNKTGTTASITDINGSLATITNLSGMDLSSTGKILTISGASSSGNNGSWVITRVLSNTSVQICNLLAVGNDANNGSINWTEVDVNSFIRGENVKQTTTNSEGELLGMHFDPITGIGFLVIQPRVIGTGSILGWSDSYSVTGDISGASITISSTPVEFVKEVVFWTGSDNLQTMTGYIQTVDALSESSSRFSSLAESTGCTATICPGGGGTNNSFPDAGSYVFVGTAGTKTDARFGLVTWTGNLTNAQIMCADTTFDTGRSADGSFTCAIGTTVDAGSYIGFSFTRLDDHEDGDLDPYIFFIPSNDNSYVPSRTVLTTVYASGGNSFNIGGNNSIFTTNLPFKNSLRGWRRRGFNDSKDSFLNFQIGLICEGAICQTGEGRGYSLFFNNAADSEKVATAQANTFVSEPLWAVNVSVGNKYFKGTTRWIRAVSGGNATLDTLGNLSWLQLSLTNPAFICGPWDGTTTPVK